MGVASVTETDVAVFGSGAGGLSAALASAIEGLDVVVFEKSDYIGGTTSISGGAAWIPGTSGVAEGVDYADTKAARGYLQRFLGNDFTADLIDPYLASGPEAIEYFRQHSEVAFTLGNVPDYRTHINGSAATGRCLVPMAFDGKRLGADFKKLRTPPKHFLVLGGMMVGRRDIPAFLSPFSSIANLRHVTGAVSRYLVDRVRQHRGTNLLMGNALVARFMFSLRERRVAMWTGASLVDLIRSGDQIVGARFIRNGQTHEVKTRKAVVLATGGFPAGATAREKYSGAFPHNQTAAPTKNVGEGIEAGAEVGGVVDPSVHTTAFWSPVTVMAKPGAEDTVMPYGHLDRGKPGAIIVTSDGQRFVNEADSYHDVVLAMFAKLKEKADQRFYLLCDRRFIREYGLGLVRPKAVSLRRFINSGYLVTGATLNELAAQIEVDVGGLKDTVSRHNAYAEIGVDLEFHKGETVFNQYNGDPECLPNNCLRPLERAPFYAARIHPGTIGTAVGLETNADAQVLDEAKQAIPGLYACGNDMASVMRGHYPGPGITIGPAITFGYRAAMHIRLTSRR